MRTVIVIPAYNEAATIAPVVSGAARFGTPLVVDDGSADETGAAAKAAGAKVLRLAPNRGYEAALEAGFAEAARMGAEAVATFDADGQLDPAVIGALLAPLREGRADLVIGVRARAARLAETLFGLYARFRFGVDDLLCGAKAYRTALYRRHGRFDGGGSVGTELALNALRRGVPFATVPVTVGPRQGGGARFGGGLRGNWRILRALALAIRADVSEALKA